MTVQVVVPWEICVIKTDNPLPLKKLRCSYLKRKKERKKINLTYISRASAYGSVLGSLGWLALALCEKGWWTSHFWLDFFFLMKSKATPSWPERRLQNESPGHWLEKHQSWVMWDWSSKSKGSVWSSKCALAVYSVGAPILCIMCCAWGQCSWDDL